jgi:ArsR family transcriptional regulator
VVGILVFGYPNAMPTLPDADADLAEVYKAASEPIRIRILGLLAHGELCVCHLHGALDAPQPTVSRHLAILRRAGLVRARRDGSWVHYALTDTAETWLAPALVRWRADEELRQRCASLRGCS